MNTLATKPLRAPKPKLLPGTIYSADNGELICLHCAGQSALYAGRDRSGHKVQPLTNADPEEWRCMTGRELACEQGCTKHINPCAP